jgi:hypothetical protein
LSATRNRVVADVSRQVDLTYGRCNRTAIERGHTFPSVASAGAAADFYSPCNRDELPHGEVRSLIGLPASGGFTRLRRVYPPLAGSHTNPPIFLIREDLVEQPGVFAKRKNGGVMDSTLGWSAPLPVESRGSLVKPPAKKINGKTEEMPLAA